MAVLAGAAGSVGLTLSTSQGRELGLLAVSIFSIWAFAPFAALGLVHMMARRWSVNTQATLYFLMLVLTLGSLQRQSWRSSRSTWRWRRVFSLTCP